MSRQKREPKTTGPGEELEWKTLVRVALAVGLAAFLLYLPSLRSEFVYDAQAQIKDGTYVHDPANLADVLTLRVLGQDVLDASRPVQLLSLMGDSLLWGRNPLGYHLTSNLLHALNAALLFLCAIILTGKSRKALWPVIVGVMVFAVHPVCVEPVAEVSSREDILATFFVLSAWFCGMQFLRHASGNFWWAGACLLATLLAAGSKETGYVIPGLIGLYWVLYRRHEAKPAWMGLLAGVTAVAVLFFAARFLFQVTDSQIFLNPPEYLGGSLAKVFELQPRLWVHLFRLIVWPVGLSADYMPQNVGNLNFWLVMVILAAVVIGQGLLAWKSRMAFLGMAVFWLGLAPVSNFLPLYRPLADRFLYLPLVGVALTVIAVLLMVRPWPVWYVSLVAALGFAVCALAGGTLRRQEVFRNSLNLWTDTVAVSPQSSTAANNLGYANLEAGKYSDALKNFNSAYQLSQGKYADALAGAALAFEAQGEQARAEECLRKAMEIQEIYGDPDKLVAAMIASPENGKVLKKIRARMGE